jgi:serine/threonine protein kinase
VPAVGLTDERGLAGKVISGYEILGRIGEGGMGTVYLALDNIKEGQLDAVKVLNRDWVADRERLRREAVTANRVDHPNVCKIYNYFEAYDTESGDALTLISMELVRGPTLREI